MDSTTQAIEPLTCGISEFAHIVGFGEGTAREIVAGPNHPPLIMVGREPRIIRDEIPAWLSWYADKSTGDYATRDDLGRLA